MAEIDSRIVAHYATAALAQRVEAAMRAGGMDPARPTVDDLAPLDEFHVGGRQATLGLAGRLELAPGQAVLDVGCGLGGTARCLAARFGCRVTGLDLTPAYAALAADLTRRAGLAGRAAFLVGNALDLPFRAACFDRATLLHVGMNVPDKRALLAGIRRCLVPGGRLGLYDIMATGAGALPWPLPWSGGPSTSFVAEPAAYRAALTAAGFAIDAEIDHRVPMLAALAGLRERAGRDGAPVLGLHVVMGADAGAKLSNLTAAMARGDVAPVEMIARAH